MLDPAYILIFFLQTDQTTRLFQTIHSKMHDEYKMNTFLPNGDEVQTRAMDVEAVYSCAFNKGYLYL